MDRQQPISSSRVPDISPRMEHPLGFIFTALRSIQRPRGGRDQIHEEARHLRKDGWETGRGQAG